MMDDDNASSVVSGSLERDFLAIPVDADVAVTDDANSTALADDIATYHQRLGDDLKHLRALWNAMHDQCAELGECPTGGGLSGDWDGACITGSHTMGAMDMNDLHQRIAEARAVLDDYWSACGAEPAGEACLTRYGEHVDGMSDAIAGMNGQCRDLWVKQE